MVTQGEKESKFAVQEAPEVAALDDQVLRDVVRSRPTEIREATRSGYL